MRMSCALDYCSFRLVLPPCFLLLLLLQVCASLSDTLLVDASDWEPSCFLPLLEAAAVGTLLLPQSDLDAVLAHAKTVMLAQPAWMSSPGAGSGGMGGTGAGGPGGASGGKMPPRTGSGSMLLQSQLIDLNDISLVVDVAQLMGTLLKCVQPHAAKALELLPASVLGASSLKGHASTQPEPVVGAAALEGALSPVPEASESAPGAPNMRAPSMGGASSADFGRTSNSSVRNSVSGSSAVAAALLHSSIAQHLQYLLELDWALVCRVHVATLLARVREVTGQVRGSELMRGATAALLGGAGPSVSSGQLMPAVAAPGTASGPAATTASAEGPAGTTPSKPQAVVQPRLSGILRSAGSVTLGRPGAVLPGTGVSSAQLHALEKLLLQWASAMVSANRIHADTELQACMHTVLSSVGGSALPLEVVLEADKALRQRNIFNSKLAEQMNRLKATAHTSGPVAASAGAGAESAAATGGAAAPQQPHQQAEQGQGQGAEGSQGAGAGVGATGSPQPAAMVVLPTGAVIKTPDVAKHDMMEATMAALRSYAGATTESATQGSATSPSPPRVRPPAAEPSTPPQPPARSRMSFQHRHHPGSLSKGSDDRHRGAVGSMGNSSSSNGGSASLMQCTLSMVGSHPRQFAHSSRRGFRSVHSDLSGCFVNPLSLAGSKCWPEASGSATAAAVAAVSGVGLAHGTSSSQMAAAPAPGEEEGREGAAPGASAAAAAPSSGTVSQPLPPLPPAQAYALCMMDPQQELRALISTASWNMAGALPKPYLGGLAGTNTTAGQQAPTLPPGLVSFQRSNRGSSGGGAPPPGAPASGNAGTGGAQQGFARNSTGCSSGTQGAPAQQGGAGGGQQGYRERPAVGTDSGGEAEVSVDVVASDTSPKQAYAAPEPDIVGDVLSKQPSSKSPIASAIKLPPPPRNGIGSSPARALELLNQQQQQQQEAAAAAAAAAQVRHLRSTLDDSAPSTPTSSSGLPLVYRDGGSVLGRQTLDSDAPPSLTDFLHMPSPSMTSMASSLRTPSMSPITSPTSAGPLPFPGAGDAAGAGAGGRRSSSSFLGQNQGGRGSPSPTSRGHWPQGGGGMNGGYSRGQQRGGANKHVQPFKQQSLNNPLFSPSPTSDDGRPRTGRYSDGDLPF